MKVYIFLIIFFLFISSCNNKPVEPSETSLIVISNFEFNPTEIIIQKGTTVTWKHDDSVTHKIVSLGIFESENLERGYEFSFTFNEIGEYNYYCSIHPSMKGKIIVK
ncbi:cupredoxin domain-containing protein [Candidatus Woesearchaeota archaeon]|nr:cupredoxin domain-containing protein [Candidatus Woesearchaeota archaeon]